MHRIIKWIGLHPIMSVLAAMVLCLGSCYFYSNSLYHVLKTIQQVEATSSHRTAFIEQLDYPSGFQTFVADQVRIADRGSSYKRQDIVFTEDAEPLSEKPTVEWNGDVLTIYFSRDANVLQLHDTLGTISIKFVRRDELLGYKPIGNLATALKDSGRTWSERDLSAKIWQTKRRREGRVATTELSDWARLLLIERCLLTDLTLKKNIQVREVAFLCIGELIDSTLLQGERPVRQDMGTGRGGRPERFDIKVISDSDVAMARDAVERYISSAEK